MIRVTIWNEFRHEKCNDAAKKIYPNGIHAAIAEFLGKQEDIVCRLAALDDPDCGLPQEVLDNTDVLMWWGHMAHHLVPDEVVERVKTAVHSGMGLVVLHSGHYSKIFRALMGTPCSLSWRENGDMERVWIVDPSHPIVQGVDRYFELEHEEVYGEPFAIPEPDKLVLAGWFEGGELFRSGCCYKRGYGNIFYFQPGHESYPTYYNKDVQTILTNAVRWAAPVIRQPIEGPWVKKITPGVKEKDYKVQ